MMRKRSSAILNCKVASPGGQQSCRERSPTGSCLTPGCNSATWPCMGQAAMLSLRGWLQLWPPTCLRVPELGKVSPVFGDPLPVTESRPGLRLYDSRCSSAPSLLSGRKKTIEFHGSMRLREITYNREKRCTGE